MQTGPHNARPISNRELDLEHRERELRRREAVLERAERAVSMIRVPKSYFAPANYPEEADWWAKQLGRG